MDYTKFQTKEEEMLDSQMMYFPQNNIASVNPPTINNQIHPHNIQEDHCFSFEDAVNQQQHPQQIKKQKQVTAKPLTEEKTQNRKQGKNFRVVIKVENENYVAPDFGKCIKSLQKGVLAKKFKKKIFSKQHFHLLINTCQQNYLTNSIKQKLKTVFRIEDEKDIEVQKLYKSDPVSSDYSSCDENEGNEVVVARAAVLQQQQVQQQQQQYQQQQQQLQLQSQKLKKKSIMKKKDNVFQQLQLEENQFQREIVQKVMQGESLKNVVKSCCKTREQQFFVIKNLQLIKNAVEVKKMLASNESQELRASLKKSANIANNNHNHLINTKQLVNQMLPFEEVASEELITELGIASTIDSAISSIENTEVQKPPQQQQQLKSSKKIKKMQQVSLQKSVSMCSSYLERMKRGGKKSEPANQNCASRQFQEDMYFDDFEF